MLSVSDRKDQTTPKLYLQPLKYMQCIPHELMTKQKVSVKTTVNSV